MAIKQNSSLSSLNKMVHYLPVVSSNSSIYAFVYNRSTVLLTKHIDLKEIQGVVNFLNYKINCVSTWVIMIDICF